MKPTVSIIMTCYNKPEWLRECIDSVLEQTYHDWELLIMDDNSGPAVWEILNSYTDPRILKFNSHVTEDKRYETARYATLINRAFPGTLGKYVTYLVDDDRYYPDRLKIMVDYMDAHPDHQVTYHALGNIGEDGILHPGNIRATKGILDGLTDDTKAFNYVDHNMVMHTRQAFRDAGGWQDVPGHWGGADAYFWDDLNKAGYLFYPVGEPNTPLGAKRYHTKNVQRLIVEGEFWAQDRQAKGLPPL